MSITPELTYLPGIRMLPTGEPIRAIGEPMAPDRSEWKRICHFDCTTGVLTVDDIDSLGWFLALVRKGVAKGREALAASKHGDLLDELGQGRVAENEFAAFVRDRVDPDHSNEADTVNHLFIQDDSVGLNAECGHDEPFVFLDSRKRT